MKPWEWTEDDLRQLISTAVRESITLDYKRCDALQRKAEKIKEISKDISAFANSGGGTIVYGIIEDKNVPTDIDVGFDPAGEITKEWLEQIISSAIQQKIDGIRIHAVDLSSRPGRVALVVYVPQSKRSPHMANDFRYYKRYNFESVPMQEYEVRDVARRQDGPDLDATISWTSSQARVAQNPYWRRILLKVSIRNNSPVVAIHAVVGLMIDVRLGIANPGGFTLQPGPLITHEAIDPSRYKNVIVCHGVRPADMPIWWKGIEMQIEPIDVQVSVREDADYSLISVISAPAMEPKLQRHVLSQRAGQIAIGTN